MKKKKKKDRITIADILDLHAQMEADYDRDAPMMMERRDVEQLAQAFSILLGEKVTVEDLQKPD